LFKRVERKSWRSWINAQTKRAGTKVHAENCIFHTSMEMTPSTNMIAEKDIGIFAYFQPGLAHEPNMVRYHQSMILYTEMR
jgi:hypothetical protein